VLPLLLLAAAALAGPARCFVAPDGARTPAQTPASFEFSLQKVVDGLESPVFLTAPAGDSRLFVVEQPGRIRIVKDGALLPAAFLDVSAKVTYGGERGLLSIAFHPHYSANGFLYVDSIDTNGSTVVERYTVSANPDAADPASAKLILTVPQPYTNHKGGLLLFGPDGKLYVGLGDGGGSGDPQGNGQNLKDLLGDILRIDVDAGDPYAVPSDNPYAGSSSARGEIWASGLRNPWRFSFDPPSGLLFIADVGQDAWEEIDVVPAAQGGLNFGWNIMEGMHCYGAGTCNDTGLTLPVAEYDHSQGCSIIGGYVYRGSRVPGLTGRYLYADYCGDWIRSLAFSDGSAGTPASVTFDGIGHVLSFGEDSSGELYVLSDNGTVYEAGPAGP
jgi:glucose/arabinose dehydrogenase